MSRVTIFFVVIVSIFIVNSNIAQIPVQSKNLSLLRHEKVNYFSNNNKYYLKGTFHKYYAAYGSGNGILLKKNLRNYRQKILLENKRQTLKILEEI